jgi:hypothetical protein
VTSRTAMLPVLIAVLLTAACGDAPLDPGTSPDVMGASDPTAPVQPANGTLHFVWLPRLQGFAEGVPCDPASIPPLPAASLIAADLEAQGDKAILVCIGDTLIQPASITGAPAAVAAAIARSNVDLDAMAAAGVDIYTPGHGDMLRGLNDLLDRTAERGIPVVISNVEVEGRDDIKPYVIVEHEGMRFAILAVIPKQGVGHSQDGRTEEAGVTFVNPGLRVRELTRQIIRQGEANAIVCLSALNNEVNQNLCKIPNLHFLIGSSNADVERDEVVNMAQTTMFLAPIAGRSVGLTSFRVADDDWNLADISDRHVLPAQLEREHKALAGYIEAFGTNDIRVLAPLVIPENPQNFIIKIELMEENSLFLEKTENWPGSYMDHQSAVIEPLPDGDPVQAILATHGAAIRSAVADLKIPVEPLLKERTIPSPEDCRSCHEAQYNHWAATDHASAYDLLVEQGRESDSSCLVCHTEGFGLLGGYRDPRHDAPFGAITCLHCHEVQAPHAFNKRLVVDPLYVSSERDAMECRTCHNPDRDPGFARAPAVDAIACPPMRTDDPMLLQVRTDAIAAIERARSRGNATDWDDYLEGRALVGMGRPDEGIPMMKSFIQGRTDWPQMTYFTARFLEEQDDAPGARELFKDYLANEPGDLQMNIAYIQLLSGSTDPEVLNPEHALSHARLIAPPDAPEFTAILMPAYLIQIEMLMEMGNTGEAQQLLMRLNQEFADNDDVNGALIKYGLRQG